MRQTVQEREWKRIKTKLTKAEFSEDPLEVLRACREADSVFHCVGWPDWWTRVERMKWDALKEVDSWW